MALPIRESRLRIDRVHAQYLVAAQHPAPEQIKARLDESVSQALARTLAAALAPLFRDADPGVWLIRRLELAVDVNSAWQPDRLARAWVAQIGRELDRVLRGGTDGANVVWFPDRAAYLAQFLADLSGGQAWSRWYYADFQGLRLLPVSAAMRTALLDEPDTGLAALAQLPGDLLVGVMRTLTVQDARQVLDRFGSGRPTTGEMRCFESAWLCLQEGPIAEFLALAEAQAGLLLYVRALRGEPGLAGASLRDAAVALIRLARLVLGAQADQAARLVAALSSGSSAELFLAAGTADGEVLLPLLRCLPEWIAGVGRAMQARRTGSSVEAATSQASRRYTPFGATFLLLPFLAELPSAQATRGWPGFEGAEAPALLRALLLAKACGADRADALLGDPLVRDLVALPPTVSAGELACWQGRLRPRHLQQFLATLAGWWRKKGAAPGQVAILARVPARGRSVAVLLDGARGVWLWAGSADLARPGPLIDAVRAWMPTRSEEATLLCDDRFLATLRPALQGLPVRSLATGTLPPDLAEAVAAVRLDRLPDDLAYLALPQDYRGPRCADLALSVAAQALLRDVAWRLPGFSRSGLAYLYTNFLDFRVSVEEEAERRVVRLGHPPLHLVLHMTGLGRRSYQLGWLDKRPFVLFPEA